MLQASAVGHIQQPYTCAQPRVQHAAHNYISQAQGAQKKSTQHFRVRHDCPQPDRLNTRVLICDPKQLCLQVNIGYPKIFTQRCV